MDAVEYLKTLRRMCDYKCRDCELGNRSGWDSCASWQKNNPEEAIAIVERWGAEHPIKTRQSEFLKLFPGVDADKTDGCLTLNPCIIYPKMREKCSGKLCHECKKAFWLAEVEDT